VLLLATAAAQGRLDAVRARIDASGGGRLLLYKGTVPSAPNSAANPSDLLATLSLAVPCASVVDPGAGSPLYLEFTPVLDQIVSASGPATWVRFTDGALTPVLDGDAGLSGSGALAIFDDVDLWAGGLVNLVSCAFTEPWSSV